MVFVDLFCPVLLAAISPIKYELKFLHFVFLCARIPAHFT